MGRGEGGAAVVITDLRGHVLREHGALRAAFQKLASPNLSGMVQESLLEEAAQQKQVLEMLSVLDFEKVSKATSIEESK